MPAATRGVSTSTKDNAQQYPDLFGCKSGSFSFKYLGIPIHFCKLKKGEWKSVEDHFKITFLVGLTIFFLMEIDYFSSIPFNKLADVYVVII
jgi:hypothetical protein